MQAFKFPILEFEQLLTYNVKARDPVGSKNDDKMFLKYYTELKIQIIQILSKSYASLFECVSKI